MQTGQGRTEELTSPVRPGPAPIPAPRRSAEFGEPDVSTYSLDAPPQVSAVTPRIVRVGQWIRSGRVAVVTLLITAAAAAGVAAAGTHAVDAYRQRAAHASAAPAPASGQNADGPVVYGTVEVPNDGPLPVRISGMRAAVPGISLSGPQIPGVVQAGKTVRIPMVVSIRCGVRLHKGSVPIAVSVRQPRGSDREVTVPLQVAAGPWADLRTPCPLAPAPRVRAAAG